MRAAKAWGILPSDLGACQPEDDLLYVVAWMNAETDMRAWEQQEAEGNKSRV